MRLVHPIPVFQSVRGGGPEARYSFEKLPLNRDRCYAERAIWRFRESCVS